MSGLSSSERQTLDAALQHLTQGVEEENKSTWHHALHQYCKGLQLLLPLLASPYCSGQFQQVLRGRCSQYINKVRDLQHQLQHVAKQSEVGVTACRDGAETDAGHGCESSEAGGGRLGESGDHCDNGQLKRRCDSVHREVTTSPSPQDNPLSGQTLASTGLDGRQDGVAPSIVLQEAQEVMAVARQLFSDEELQAQEQQQQQENTVRSQQQEVLLKVLHRILTTVTDTATDNSWVAAPGVGLDHMELRLRECLVLPLLFPSIFSRRQLVSRRSILLYGHDGNGILALLQHQCSQHGHRLHIVSTQRLAEVVESGVLSAANLVKGLMARVLQSAPCALCLTGLEVLGHSWQHRERMQDAVRGLMCELMVHMDGCGQQSDVVFFVGITSQPWLLQSAFRRRFSHQYCHVPSPTAEERVAVLMAALKGVPHTLNEHQLWKTASKTELFTRMDMVRLAEEAQAMVKLRLQESRFFKPVLSEPLSPQQSHHGSTVSHSRSEHHAAGTRTDFNSASARADCDHHRQQEEDAQVEHTERKQSKREEEDRDNKVTGDMQEKGLENQSVTTGQAATSGTETVEECGLAFSSADRGSRTNNQTGVHSLDADRRTCAAPLVADGSVELTESVDDVARHSTAVSGSKVTYTPCDESDQDAIAMRWSDVGGDQLQEPELSYCDVVSAIHSTGGHLDQDDVRRLNEWLDSS